MDERQSWTSLLGEVVALRHALHQVPELAWQEHQTAARIRQELDRAGIAWRACAGTGTVATVAPRASGRHVAFRGDIDALPIQEETGVHFASTIPGRMHACGHDGHTAALLGLGRWLKRHEDRLPGPVSLLFQPAEEGGHGAERMIEEGALRGVEVIYGWHNWPSIPWGKAVCPDGPVMAANGTFEVQVTGRGGHAAEPEACANPTVGAAAITVALQHLLNGRVRPQRPHVLTVSSIEAPSSHTVIPGHALLRGTVRAADTADRDALLLRMREIIEATATAWGVAAAFEPRPRYPATVNQEGPAAQMRSALTAVLGESWDSRETPIPIMASEDFSYYLQEIPGAFMLVGSNDCAAHAWPCHSPFYAFNDRLLSPVMQTFCRLAGAPVVEG